MEKEIHWALSTSNETEKTQSDEALKTLLLGCAGYFLMLFGLFLVGTSLAQNVLLVKISTGYGIWEHFPLSWDSDYLILSSQGALSVGITSLLILSLTWYKLGKVSDDEHMKLYGILAIPGLIYVFALYIAIILSMPTLGTDDKLPAVLSSSLCWLPAGILLWFIHRKIEASAKWIGLTWSALAIFTPAILLGSVMSENLEMAPLIVGIFFFVVVISYFILLQALEIRNLFRIKRDFKESIFGSASIAGSIGLITLIVGFVLNFLSIVLVQSIDVSLQWQIFLLGGAIIILSIWLGMIKSVFAGIGFLMKILERRTRHAQKYVNNVSDMERVLVKGSRRTRLHKSKSSLR